MKRLVILLISIITIVSLVGCGAKEKESEKEPEVVLNERQKQILEEVELPTEYEELNYTQQKAIVRIEEMLTYLDEKYDEEFAYCGYISKSVLEPEQLFAYKVGTDRDFDSFTVETTENGFEDDYIEFISTDLFSEYIWDLVKELCPDTEMKVYSDITDTTLTEIPDEKSKFDGTTEGIIMIYLDGQTCSDEQYAYVQSNLGNLLKEHEIYCMADILRTKDDVIVYLTKYNHTDYLSDEFYSDRESIYVKK